MVVRRPAPEGVCRAGPARPDAAAILGLQSGLCAGPERAFLYAGLDGHHPAGHGAGGSRGEGAQASCGNLRQIPDRLESGTIIEGGNEKEAGMTILTRRSVLRSSAALAAAGTLARPFIANAAASTAAV